MPILTELLEGKQIRFQEGDIDLWMYNSEENRIEQIIDREPTGFFLQVLDVNDDNITINWGEGQSTLSMFDIELI